MKQSTSDSKQIVHLAQGIVYSLLLAFFLERPIFAAPVYISVGQAKVKKTVLAIPFPKISIDSENARKLSKSVHQTILRDLDFTTLFKVQDPAAFLEPQAPVGSSISLESFKLSDWSTIGTEFLVKTLATLATENTFSVEFRLYDVLGGKQLAGKKYSASINEATLLGHTIANEIMKTLTGNPGMFLSRLTFVCNKSGHKEIYVADYDGENPRQMTRHGSLAFAPAWSPDGKKIAYSVYTKNSSNVKNIDLYEMDVTTRQLTLLSNRTGTNSGAHYSPNGTKIALTMSYQGNQEIYVLDRSTRQITKLTQSFGFDVDPSWSPDGRKIAFVSSRSGQPMIFSMNADGSGVQRITFAGKFNATPSWSPDGKKIAFAGWNDGHFDVFVMDADGRNLERLTKNEGSNEDTTFSPDGNYIAFSSTRGGSGKKDVYAISLDGQTTRRLTSGLGNCEAPKWGTPGELSGN